MLVQHRRDAGGIKFHHNIIRAAELLRAQGNLVKAATRAQLLQRRFGVCRRAQHDGIAENLYQVVIQPVNRDAANHGFAEKPVGGFLRQRGAEGVAGIAERRDNENPRQLPHFVEFLAFEIAGRHKHDNSLHGQDGQEHGDGDAPADFAAPDAHRAGQMVPERRGAELLPERARKGRAGFADRFWCVIPLCQSRTPVPVCILQFICSCLPSLTVRNLDSGSSLRL